MKSNNRGASATALVRDMSLGVQCSDLGARCDDQMPKSSCNNMQMLGVIGNLGTAPW